jgi:hypothetical protein
MVVRQQLLMGHEGCKSTVCGAGQTVGDDSDLRCYLQVLLLIDNPNLARCKGKGASMECVNQRKSNIRMHSTCLNAAVNAPVGSHLMDAWS